MSFAFTEMDVEWKKVLRERLAVHGDAYDARALWNDLVSLKQYPNLDEKGKEALERLGTLPRYSFIINNDSCVGVSYTDN